MLTGGGFPSTHATLTSTITTAIGIREGLTSPIFGLGVALSIIIMYDAMNVRYYAGKNISLTKQIVRDLKSHGVKLTGPMYVEKIKEILGHSKIEVIAGCIWGIVVSVVVNYIL